MTDIIYIDPIHPCKQTYHFKPIDNGIKYIRSDIVEQRVKDEREGCAKIAEDKILSMKSSGKSGYCFDVVILYLAGIAKAIRGE